MNNTYSAALTISAIVSGILMFIFWRRRALPGAPGLAVTMAAFFIWAITYAVRWSVNSHPAQFF
jgi:hypothetical protein